ncbi:MAG: diguanylate cyclase domain-containing protein [Inhella sp.]|uniref:diguanylate cyclase domain-containing protein n=1 Tax=Inhella sp. TaxID=1921806 RepID=UPI00391989A7
MRRVLERWRAGFLLLVLSLLSMGVQALSPLALNDDEGAVQVWPAVTVLMDPSRSWSLDEARQRVGEFAAPTTAFATLGQRRDAVWMRVPVQVASQSDGRWVFDVDYAVLNRIDVYLLSSRGEVLRHVRMGNTVLAAERPMPSRSHAVELDFRPGEAHELWVRVESLGALIVPMTLNKEPAFLSRALREQMLQGLLLGVGVCLIAYSLAQWLTLREALLLKYAVLIGGGVMFSVVQFGIGAQYFWTDVFWFDMHLAGISALMASTGTFLFVEEVLRGPERHRWFSPVMKAGAAFLVAVAWAYGVGWIDLHVVSKVIGTVGLMPGLMGLPGAVQRARQGDSVGWYFLVAWLGYFVSTTIMVLVIRGVVPANFWTQHSFQLGATLDMLLFLRVLALRLHAVHEQALRVAHERDHALSVAATDALTGLLNRRGLQAALNEALPAGKPGQITAVYLIDLDGFKPVNDEFGHEVGDRLLVAVSDRLRALLRQADLVARLGGDEFVVLAQGLSNEAHAQRLGEELLAAFQEPFPLDGLIVRVGATIGYALSPMDGSDPHHLLQRADAAMYEGKRRGKRRLTRL